MLYISTSYYTLFRKLLWLMCCCLLAGAVSAQDDNPLLKELNRAKAEMKLELSGETPDYVKAGKILEPIVSSDPGNAEAWYFFGYAIDKYNTGTGESMLQAGLPLAIRASEAFQNAIELSDGSYKGERLIFDPHTKILTIWGTQALRYLNQNQRDSAYWCINQAAIRGGINKTVLGYFRQVMQECSYGSYLFTTGDMYLYYMIYLQLVESYRTDVHCINLNYLNMPWSVALLTKARVLGDSLGQYLSNTEDKTKWQSQMVQIRNDNRDVTGGDSVINWTVKPSNGGYLLRSDVILLRFLRYNAFRHDVFFVSDVPANMRLSLSVSNYLQLRGLTQKLVADTSQSNLNFIESRLKRLDPISVEDSSYLNNPDNIQVLNNFRFAYTAAAVTASDKGKADLALELIELAERKYPEKVLPFYADATKQWFVQLKDRAEKKEPLIW